MNKVLVIFHPLNDLLQHLQQKGAPVARHQYWCYDHIRESEWDTIVAPPTNPDSWLNRMGKKVGFNLLEQQVNCLLTQNKYDVVFVPYPTFAFFLIMLRSLRLFKKNIVVIVHDTYPVDKENIIKRLKQKMIRYCYFKGSDEVIFYNEYLLNEAQKSSVKGNFTFLEGFGVDFDFFNDFTRAQTEAPRADYVYSTGGTARDYTTLVTAFNQLDFKLKITTAGNLDGFEGSVFTPNIELDNSLPFGLGSTGLIRKEYYHALAVAISLAKVERDRTYGMTVLFEAMAMSKPVITTHNKTFPLHVEKEKVGLTVDYGDVEGWRQAVKYMIDHPEEAKEMGERGAHLVRKKYNYNSFSQQVTKHIGQFLPKKKGAVNKKLTNMEMNF